MRGYLFMIKATFNNIELWALWSLANKRQRNKERLNVKTRKIDSSSDVAINYFGLKGEYAVARLLDLEISTINYAGGDGGVDLVYNGITIDVKSTTTADLIFNSDGHFKADVAFLVRPDNLPTYTSILEVPKIDPYIKRGKYRMRDLAIAGWITKAAFIFTADVKDFGYGPRKVIAGAKLTNPHLFKKKYGIKTPA